jgi:AhpD family alkylhydroperoxidase
VSTPRVTPGGRRELGVVVWGLTRAAGRAMGTGPPNLFTTLGRHRPLLRGWLSFARRLMPGGKLSRRDTELVILRVAHLRACTYEHEHHVRLGRRAGLTDEDFRRVEEGPAADGWEQRERTLLAAVDELHETQDVRDETWSALWGLYDDRRLIELVMLVGHYEMLATVIGTLRIQPDGGV